VITSNGYPPELPGWVIGYPWGRRVTPDTREWVELRERVEAVATAALVVAGAPF